MADVEEGGERIEKVEGLCRRRGFWTKQVGLAWRRKGANKRASLALSCTLHTQ